MFCTRGKMSGRGCSFPELVLTEKQNPVSLFLSSVLQRTLQTLHLACVIFLIKKRERELKEGIKEGEKSKTK